MKDRFIIGVAGGTGAGKTTLCNQLFSLFDPKDVAYIRQDDYYHDLSYLPEMEREKHNYDHPNAIDNKQLMADLKALVAGEEVDIPIYDFRTHTRTTETHKVKSHKIIILEGILVLHFRELRDIFDLKIFVDTPADIRFMRRLERDMAKRGRTLESVLKQYKNTVRPMHTLYVEPCKEYADIVISGMNDIQPIINLLATQMNAYIDKVNQTLKV